MSIFFIIICAVAVLNAYAVFHTVHIDGETGNSSRPWWRWPLIALFAASVYWAYAHTGSTLWLAFVAGFHAISFMFWITWQGACSGCDRKQQCSKCAGIKFSNKGIHKLNVLDRIIVSCLTGVGSSDLGPD